MQEQPPRTSGVGSVGRPSFSSSSIPVLSPKSTKSALPSTISTPQLGLTPSRRTVSIGASPPRSQASNPHRPSGLPSLRSLRSFLPFGSSNGATNSGVIGNAKVPFPAFGVAGRRSATIERKPSSTYPRSELEKDTSSRTVISVRSDESLRPRTDSVSHKARPESTRPSPIQPPDTGASQGEPAVLDISAPSATIITPAPLHRSQDPISNQLVDRVTPSPQLGLPARAEVQPSDSGSVNSVHSQISRDNSSEPPVITYAPELQSSHELSTILESDLSGLSKHLPALPVDDDDADESDDAAPSDLSSSPGKRASRHSLFSPTAPRRVERALVVPDSLALPGTLKLELDTSDLRTEVMNAMKGSHSQRTSWLSPCDIQDLADSRPSSANAKSPTPPPQIPDPSPDLRLDIIDADLAALLSPNYLVQSAAPTPPSSVTPPNSAALQSAVSLGHTYSPLTAASSGSLTSQPSPPRPFRQSSLIRGTPSTSPTTPTFPRPLHRVAADRANQHHLWDERSLERISGSRGATSDPSLPLEQHGRHASEDGVLLSRGPAPPSPLSADVAPRGSLDYDRSDRSRFALPRASSQRIASRLATPNRPSLYNPIRIFRSATNSADSTSRWETESTPPLFRPPSTSPSSASRAPTVLSRASSSQAVPRRPTPGRSRPSLDEGRRPSFPGIGMGYSRTRLRSFSASESYTDLIGPRTSRAFAAAGVLSDRETDPRDRERERELRFGSVRSLERGLAPSRAAFSDTGSGSASASYRSASRTEYGFGGGSMRGGPRSEMGFATSSVDTPLSALTTSGLSRSSSPQPPHSQQQNALASIKEKHAAETSALLSALADSQRSVMELRAENGVLKEKLEGLEAELVRAYAQMRNMEKQQQRQQQAMATMRERMSPAPPDDYRSRYHLQPRSVSAATTVHANGSGLLPALGDEVPFRSNGDKTYYRQSNSHSSALGHGRKPSGSGSVFARPPSDMVMLMHEDDDDTHAMGYVTSSSTRRRGGTSSASASPVRRASTVLVDDPTERYAAVPNAHQQERRSQSSAQAALSPSSPTAPSVSMSMTTSGAGSGSPRSLYLRPEHEMLLGEMPSLDSMRFGSDDGDSL